MKVHLSTREATVGKLIEALMKVEDKSLEVRTLDDDWSAEFKVVEYEGKDSKYVEVG